MSKITIQNAKKQYGDTTVIEGLNLEIRDGELFTLLGPSGCGKTTLLRMIAGFNSIEGGDFYFNEERINDKEPSKRNIGMVFQNYAIFPHMTVAKNVAYGLKNRKTPRMRSPGRQTAFWRSCRSSSTPTGCRRICLAASSSAWRWPVRWSSSRTCC